MNTIIEQFQDKINGTFSFFDRMIIKGHIRQFFSLSGKKHFLSYNNVLLMDFSAYAAQVTDSIVSHVEALTTSLGRPLVYLPSSRTSKEQAAREILSASPVEEGLICTLSTVEYCSTLQPVKQQDGKLALNNVNRRCKYYYFYFQDMEFGFMHVKLQTWFPFQVQAYINGRELMKHVFDENGITYSMYDNSFTEISDIEKAQKLADRFDSKKLCRQLDHFAYRLNPYLNTITNSFGQGYPWCVDQCEYATDVMFKSREALEDIYPSLAEHAFYDFKCTDVFSFLGRKLSNKFQGEVVSDYRKRPEGRRVKHRMKSKGRSYTGFNVWEKETFELFEELSNGAYLIRGFTNKEIRRALYCKEKADEKVNRNRIPRLFGKLRVHGLIKKIPHSLRYLAAEKGRRVMGALIETKKRTYPELAS